jgi:precorrin-3B synthase
MTALGTASGTVTGLDALVRGWCPGALRPMESGDGLIVRLRISLGVVDIVLAEQIARWSRRWGNGQIDLSNRGNLQLRGLSPQHLPDLHDALAEYGLLERGEASEAVRNVIASPLAGLDPAAVLDVRPIAKGLEQRLTGNASLHGLPGKFGFAIDDGGSLGLDDVAADIRFVARPTTDGPAFAIHLAGASRDPLGPCRPDALMDVAEALSRVFLRRRIGRHTEIRRMRDLVAECGAEAIGREAGLAPVGLPRTARVIHPPRFLGVHPLGVTAFVGVGLPYGRITAEDVAELASIAAVDGARDLRLTPWRAILLPVPSLSAAHAVSAGLVGRSFIRDPDDPVRRIAACPGAPSCERGTVPVRSDAACLAAEIAGVPGCGIVLHVSGCEKGCAHPRPATVTLVGRNGRYDLVRDGIASGSPALRNMTLDQAAQQVRHIVASQPRGGAA